MKKTMKKADMTGIDKIIAEIANNPTISSEALIRKAMELGYDPTDLIDAALGSVKYEKSKASLQKPIEDILNDVFEKNLTPGKRYVIDPSEATSRRGKEVAKALGEDLGVSVSIDTGKSRSIPDYVAVRPSYSDLEKLKNIAHAGHEIEHTTDFLIRPNNVIKTTTPYKKGHHFKEIYEPAELIREVKNLPQDEKVAKEILKQSKKAGLKPHIFSKLRSVLGPLATGVGVYSALKSGDVAGAILNAGALLDPTGVLDAAAEVKDRLNMSPKEQKQINKEDKYSAMGSALSPSDIMLDQLEELEIEKEMQKRKKQLGYE